MSGRGSERILLMIEWLAGQTEPANLAEVVAALGIPKSSALGLLRMLVNLGYVEKPDATHYRLIRLPGEVGGQETAHGTLLRLLKGTLERAVRQAGESGFIAVFENDYCVRYLNKIMPDREIRYDRDISVARQPFQVTSGLVLLGGLDDEALAACAQKAEVDGGVGQLAQEMIALVSSTKARGYAANLQGVVEGAAGVAAPIFNSEGRIVAALNIAGPELRLSGNIKALIKLTTNFANEATEILSNSRNQTWRQEQR